MLLVQYFLDLRTRAVNVLRILPVFLIYLCEDCVINRSSSAQVFNPSPINTVSSLYWLKFFIYCDITAWGYQLVPPKVVYWLYMHVMCVCLILPSSTYSFFLTTGLISTVSLINDFWQLAITTRSPCNMWGMQ